MKLGELEKETMPEADMHHNPHHPPHPDDVHHHPHHHDHPTPEELCKHRDPLYDIGYIDNLAELRNYILMQLGAPVICIELSQEQITSIIGDCIRYFWKYYKGAQREDYLAFELIPGMTHYKICQELDEVVNFEAANWLGGINDLFTPAHNLMYSSLINQGGMGFNSTCWGGAAYGDVLGHWNGMLTWLKEARNTFSTKYQVEYIREEKLLYVRPTPQKPEHGLLRVYKREHVKNIIQDPLFRKMVVARCGMVWTNALRKYSLQLSGGGQLNADSLFSSYKEEYDWCLEQIRLESPNGEFYVG